MVREINIERAKKIIIEASEQSNRISVPEILPVQNLENFMKNLAKKNVNLIFCDINCEINNSKIFYQNKIPHVF